MSELKEYWHNITTERSFKLLQELRRQFDFVLIGGWAVYFYTKSLKSKDIDFICDYETLAKLKKEFDVVKNEHLNKYEIKAPGFDVDIYLPHWSQLGLPSEEIIKNPVSIEGFKVPAKEALLVLKLYIFNQRKASLKGKKDKIDIISLLYFNNLNMEKFNRLLIDYKLGHLESELDELLDSTIELPELNLNQKQFSDFKKKLRKK